MPEGTDYAPEEWGTSAGHFPLRGCTDEELALVHRHWMWANQQREAFDRSLTAADLRDPGPAMLATVSMGFMFAWYGMLWAVVEACVEDRRLPIAGAFQADIEHMSDLLRRCRNAVLHVPRNNSLLDTRIEQLVAEPTAVERIRRIHRGFGRLFLEEFARRRQAEVVASTPLAEPREQA